MSRRREALRRRQARVMLHAELPRRWQFLLKLPRWIVFFLPYRRALREAEQQLARRHRRALRGDLMLPAKGNRS